MNKKLVIILGTCLIGIIGLVAGRSILSAQDAPPKEEDNVEEVLPSLEGMTQSSTSYPNWIKYTNDHYVPLVQNPDFDLFTQEGPSETAPALVYIYVNGTTGERVNFSAYEKFPNENIVDTLAGIIIQKPEGLATSKYYLIAGGSVIKDNWASYSVSATKPRPTTLDFTPLSVILHKDSETNWTGVLQGTLEYEDLLKKVPDDVMTTQAKQDQLLLNMNLYEKYN